MAQDGERKDGAGEAGTAPRISPADSRMARGLLGWSLVDLCKASSVDEAKLALFECGIALDGGADVARALAQAFEAAGLDYRPAGALGMADLVGSAPTARPRVIPGRPSGYVEPMPDLGEHERRGRGLKARGWTRDVMCELLESRHPKDGRSFWADPDGRLFVSMDGMESPVRPDWIAWERPLYDVVVNCAKAIWDADPRRASVPFDEARDTVGYRACVTAAWACVLAYDNGRQLSGLARRLRRTAP